MAASLGPRGYYIMFRSRLARSTPTMYLRSPSQNVSLKLASGQDIIVCSRQAGSRRERRAAHPPRPLLGRHLTKLPMPELPRDLNGLKGRSQQALIDFLDAALSLGNTFLLVAETEATLDRDHSNRAFRKAQGALDSVRHFQGRIEDPAEWEKAHTKANQLEAAIDAFRSRRPDSADL